MAVRAGARRAMRRVAKLSHHAPPPVLTRANGFEVFRTNTSGRSAQMVEVYSAWDGAMQLHVSPTMGQDCAASAATTEYSVANVECSSPQPTRAKIRVPCGDRPVLVDLRPEAVMDGLLAGVSGAVCAESIVMQRTKSVGVTAPLAAVHGAEGLTARTAQPPLVVASAHIADASGLLTLTTDTQSSRLAIGNEGRGAPPPHPHVMGRTQPIAMYSHGTTRHVAISDGLCHSGTSSFSADDVTVKTGG